MPEQRGEATYQLRYCSKRMRKVLANATLAPIEDEREGWASMTDVVNVTIQKTILVFWIIMCQSGLMAVSC